MLVIGFGTYDRARHPRVGILLDGLAAAGDEIVEINRPWHFDTAGRVEVLRHPWLGCRPLGRLLRCWAGLVVAAWRRRGDDGRTFGRPDAVLVGYLGHFDVLLARLVFPRSLVVLDQMVFAADTARDRGVRSGVGLRTLDSIDRLACRAADIVVVDTVEHAGLVPPERRSKTVVAPVGASSEWFSAGDARPDGDGPGRGVRPHDARPDGDGPGRGVRPLRAVFFGLFTPLQGATVIGEALALLAGADDVEVTMVGQGQDLAEARSLAAANDRVSWLGWVEPDKLPALVATHDVCLGIFGTSTKAQRVVPNKVYQGAAVGCALVTSDTVPQRRALGDAALYVPAGDARGLARALGVLAADRTRVASLGLVAARLARADFSAAAVVSDLREVLGRRGR